MPRQMRGDACFLKVQWAGVCRAGGKGLPRAGLERGHSAGVAHGTSAFTCSARPRPYMGKGRHSSWQRVRGAGKVVLPGRGASRDG